MKARSHVFGYGSLAADLGDARPAALRGWRRVWGVATDNERAIPGYKQYLRRDDGSRPPVYVAFLDVVEDPSGIVHGVVAAVADGAWEELDRRERNYERVDVSAAVEPPQADPVFTYVGSAPGRERFRSGRQKGRMVISRDYLMNVRAGFERLGIEDEVEHPGIEVWDLDRIDLPGGS